MRQNTFCLPLCQLVVVLQLLLAFAIAIETEVCWSSDQECIIQATLHQVTDSDADGNLPMEIDCLASTESLNREEEGIADSLYTLRRFKRVQNVTLDGCHTPTLGTTSYGFEFLPNCYTIRKVIVERFHADVLQQFHCPSISAIQTEIIVFRRNEIGTIAEDSFATLPHLSEIHLIGNTLRHIEHGSFDGLRELQVLHIEMEPLLAIKDSQLLRDTSLSEVVLISLKRVTPLLFQHLPESLRKIYVANTIDADDGKIAMTNPGRVQNISIISCALNSFSLVDDHSSVLNVNLSGNAIEEFQVNSSALDSGSSVETLDLSANSLTYLPMQWLSHLAKLRHIVLRENLLKTLSLPQLCAASPQALTIDLSVNKLTMLKELSLSVDANCDHTHIQIDHNPWNCMWLLDLAHTYPEKFRIFRYDKFISQINVNGLACSPDEWNGNEEVPANEDEEPHGINTSEAIPIPLNVSTYTLVYGNWDFKRNQRAEALIIVFMLPLGIAFLFLLLYMWIHCQKMFHLSYYRSLPLIGKHAAPSTSAERFDVVRNMQTGVSTTANTNEGYETPLNGVATACNCNNITGSPNDASEKCTKAHHITYEALPDETPYKIYEEIVEEDGDVQRSAGAAATHPPFYDHLAYAQPAVCDNYC